MSYDSWLEGPYQRMVERGEEEMLAREEIEMAMAALREQRKACADPATIPDDAYCDCCGLRLARVRASVDCVLCAGCAADGLGAR